MPETIPDARSRLAGFLARRPFAERGALVTDLDGTAVLEHEGRIRIPDAVERGLARIHALGRPVIANTLRFPRSVIDVFHGEWDRTTGSALPLVSMKGSQIGRVVRSATGAVGFEPWRSQTLSAAEIGEVMQGVEGLVADGVSELLVFHYREDWTQGERIWTPDAAQVEAVAAKYRSASAVVSGPVDALREMLLAEPLCMIFLLVNHPHDRRMAYQHIDRASFFVHQGVSKRSGARAMAAQLGFDLAASIGCGDAPPDDFLAECGLAIVVGANEVEYRGLDDTLRVDSVDALGELLATIGEALR